MPSNPLLTLRRRAPLPDATTLQTLQPSRSSIVSVTFSPTGHYLAAAVQHGTIILYAVLPSRHSDSPSQILHTTPARTFRGHVADVLHLTFSPTNFLASASMDRSVRLWHPNSAGALRTLPHADMATFAAFNPATENLLLTGGADGRVCVWRLTENQLVAEARAGAVITAGAFCTSRRAAVGTYDGRVLGWRPRMRDSSAGVETLREVLVDARRARKPGRKSRPGASARLSATVLERSGIHKRRTYFTAAGGRLFELRDGTLVRRLRTPTGTKGGAGASADVSGDGRFVVVDVAGPAVRLMDVLSAEDAQSKERERDSSDRTAIARTIDIPVLRKGACVTSAAIAGEAVRKRCGRNGHRTAVLMAVGGDDGSLRVVEQLFPDF